MFLPAPPAIMSPPAAAVSDDTGNRAPGQVLRPEQRLQSRADSAGVSPGEVDTEDRLTRDTLRHGVTLRSRIPALFLATRRLRHFSFSTKLGTDPIVDRFMNKAG